jgi:hypothetical protein
MRKLLTTTAVFEGAIGLAFLVYPSFVTSLMLGSSLDTPLSLVVARVAGIALLTLGAACWLARHDELARAARGLVVAMVIYNTSIIALLVYAALAAKLSGIACWPAVAVHTVMGFWCATRIGARRP